MFKTLNLSPQPVAGFSTESAAVFPYDSFYRKFVTRTVSRLMSPQIALSEDIMLPKVSAIHYFPETGMELGIDPSHSLMRNIGDRVLGYHVEDMVITAGRPRKTLTSAKSLIRTYHKRHRNMTLVRDISISNMNKQLHMVVNYSMLSRMYTYPTNNMLVYQEWSNNRATMWKTITDLGTERYHFIRYKMPEFLPSRPEFKRFSEKFTLRGLENFGTTEGLDLLELWTMLDEGIDGGIDSTLSDELMANIILTFVESGSVAMVNMLDLVTWKRDNQSATLLAFYKFLDILMSKRTNLTTTEVANAADDETVVGEEEEELFDEDGEPVARAKVDEVIAAGNNSIAARVEGDDVPEDEPEEPGVDTIPYGEVAIDTAITARAATGQISKAEQRGLKVLAERYKRIPNPITGEGTLADMVVDTEDLTIGEETLMSDSITIHDKSMLKSKINDLDKQYIEKVYHKDIVSMLLHTQNAGVIIKDVKAKEKNDASTRSITYSVSFQPIGGKASTVHFTVPSLDPDGTFFAKGVRYRLDKQRGDMPIAKIKPYTVGLTSYYGKAFVVRNQNAVSNYGRWLRKQILKRSGDPENTTIDRVVHGSNRFIDVALPRSYTAIGETISSFNVNDKIFYFVYSKLNVFFSEEELKNPQLRRRKLIPVGRSDKGLLGMDSDGVVYEIADGKVEVLGSLANIIDPDMGEGPIEYTEMSVYSRRIPLILAFAYRYGFDKALKRLKIKSVRLPKGARSPLAANANVYRLKLKDEDLLIQINSPEEALLVGGLNSVRRIIRGYTAAALNKKSIYGSLLANSGVTSYHLRELDLMWDMYIDPITFGLLKDMDEPTDMPGLLLRANELLVNDYIPKFNEARFKGYERISGMIYSELIQALRTQRNQGGSPNAMVSMNPQAVWLDILKDQSIALVEESNPIHNLKEKEAVTFSGHGGRSARTLLQAARGFNEGDLGVVSESTPDSNKVGIRTFLSANPNIINLRGLTRPYDPEIDGPSAVISTSALTSPSSNHD